MSEVTRPAVRWHGGKFRLAPWILSFCPQHRVYTEVFGGGASVLLRKARSAAEVYNDLDGEVVNLFRVLQDAERGTQLVDMLRVTPFARSEFEISDKPTRNRVERARRLVIRSFMGFGSNAHNARPTGFRSFSRTHIGIDRSTGFRGTSSRSKRHDTGMRTWTGFRTNSNGSNTTPAHDWMNYPDSVEAIRSRFMGVVIENRDAVKVLAQHDSPQTVHYVDPPYLPETRSPANKYDLRYRMYRYEMTREDHEHLLAYLQTLQGMVVLSGYPSALYDSSLPGWRRHETVAMADGARPRTEVLWLNPACVAALECERAGSGTPLFQRVEAMG